MRAIGLALCALLPLAALPALAQTDAARVRPPAEQSCPPNQLTLYGGQVLSYNRAKGKTVIRIRTDWNTTETVTLRHPGSDDPSRWFLLGQQPFTVADWMHIEKKPGHLRPGLRVAAWVCDDGRNATIDWAPPRAP
jgi:hypothetical protein